MSIEMKYRVEFYDGPISDGEAVNWFEPSTVPYAFSVGDFVDPLGWGGKNPLPADEHYETTAVEHQISFARQSPTGATQHCDLA